MKKIFIVILFINLILSGCSANGRLNNSEKSFNVGNYKAGYMPEEAKILLNQGIQKIKSGNTKLAIKDFQDLIKLYPEQKEGYYNLGLAYAKENQLKNAVMAWNKVILLDNNYSDAYYNLGLAYKMLNDNNKAVENLTQYILLHPDDPQINEIKKEISQLREPYLGKGIIGRVSITDEIDFEHNIAKSVKNIFNSSTPYVYSCLEIINAPKNTNIEVRWYFKTVDNQKLPINSSIFHINGSKNVILSIKKPSPEWPIGNYYLEILVDDQPNISVPFNIQNTGES